MKNFMKLKIVKVAMVLFVIVLIAGGIFASRKLERIFNNNTMSSSDSTVYREENKKEISPLNIPDNTGMVQSGQSEEKILQHARVSIDIENQNFNEIFEKLTVTAKSFGGYVKDANYTENKSEYFGFVRVMIPSEKLNGFLQYLKSVGKTKDFELSSEDRSSEYRDLEGRLKIMESQRALLLSWLDKSKSVNDMLNIRRELEKVEEEIEQTKGRMKYIEFHSQYSDVYIALHKNILSKNSSYLLTLIKDMGRKMLYGIIYSFAWLLIVAAWIAPYLLILFITYEIWKKKKS